MSDQAAAASRCAVATLGCDANTGVRCQHCRRQFELHSGYFRDDNADLESQRRSAGPSRQLARQRAGRCTESRRRRKLRADKAGLQSRQRNQGVDVEAAALSLRDGIGAGNGHVAGSPGCVGCCSHANGHTAAYQCLATTCATSATCVLCASALRASSRHCAASRPARIRP